MVLGARVTGPGFTALPNVYVMMNFHKKLIKFDIAPVTTGNSAAGLRLRWAISDFNLETRLPSGFGAIRTLDLPPPTTVGEATWLALEQDPAVVTVPAGITPYVPLAEKLWDLALQKTPDGRVLVMASSSCAIGNVGVLLNKTGVTLENALQ